MITKQKFLINKELALSEYDEFINNDETYYIGKECTINRGIFTKDKDKINIHFNKIFDLIYTILTAIHNIKLSWADFKLSENILNTYDRKSQRDGFANRESVIKYIDEYNFMVSRSLSLRVLNDKLKLDKLYPNTTGYKNENNSITKHKLARYKKPKRRKLPRQVWWDLGEDLEFIEPELVKEFKEYYVNYYIYYSNVKYKNRANSVEKYKLMFQRMSEMQSKYKGLPT
jgi:hypothetical protein